MRVGGGTEDGANAALTSERGLGKRTAMRGASGLERVYDPSDPVAVIIVRSARAGKGESNDPTSMF